MAHDSDNPYAPPKAPIRLSQEEAFIEATELRDRLIREQSYFRVFLVAFLGSIVGIVVLALFLITPGIFFLAFALPGTLTGFALRHFGRILDSPYKLFGAVITFLAYWLLINSLHPSSVMVGFMLSFLNAVVAGYISQRSLTVEEESAIYLHRMGIE